MALGTVNKSCSNTHAIVIKCSPCPGPGPSSHRTAVLTLSNHAGFSSLTFAPPSSPEPQVWPRPSAQPRFPSLASGFLPDYSVSILQSVPRSTQLTSTTLPGRLAPPAEATRVPSPGAPVPIQVSHLKQGQPGFMPPEHFDLTSLPGSTGGRPAPSNRPTLTTSRF